MDDFEFLRKIKEIENKRMKEMLKKDSKSVEKEMKKIFDYVKKTKPQMVEVVELTNTEEFTV